MPDLDLFDKTELWLVGARLTNVDLADLAAVAATALSLPPSAVFVTDVRDDHVVFDLVVPKVRLEDVVGREPEFLAAVSAVPGVALAPGAEVHSRGVLGVLGAPKAQAAAIVQSAATLEANLRAFVARRVAVVSTGAEVAEGQIQDTNLAAVRETFEAAGFEVTFGGVAGDDERAIAGLVGRLAGDGFGLIITTGGVGAEDKDRTIEALEALDPAVATAVLATYEVGHGRHVKPHVRVACARLGETTVVALPGPTREVRAALPALVRSLAEGAPASVVAEAVAEPIRALWREQPSGGHAYHQHPHR